MQGLSTLPEGLSLEELNQKLLLGIDHHYHTAIHSSTKEPPLKRYLKDIPLIREAPSDPEDYFRKRALRKVDKDRTVSIPGKVYEAPIELIGQRVTLLLDKLLYHSSRPLASRVVGRSHLEGLKLKEMAGYLKHHPEIAGIREQLVSSEAVLAIHQASGGLLRKANLLAKGSLIAAARDECNLW
jgi:hypothetical protein